MKQTFFICSKFVVSNRKTVTSFLIAISQLLLSLYQASRLYFGFSLSKMSKYYGEDDFIGRDDFENNNYSHRSGSPKAREV